MQKDCCVLGNDVKAQVVRKEATNESWSPREGQKKHDVQTEGVKAKRTTEAKEIKRKNPSMDSSV